MFNHCDCLPFLQIPYVSLYFGVCVLPLILFSLGLVHRCQLPSGFLVSFWIFCALFKWPLHLGLPPFLMCWHTQYKFSDLHNKTFCSRVAEVVSLACLIGIARCSEAFQCVTELVLLHNIDHRHHRNPTNNHLGVLSVLFIEYWSSGKSSEPAIAGPFYSTLPTEASSGIYVSFHTWCWFTASSQQSSKQLWFQTANRCHANGSYWASSLSLFLEV